MLIDISVLEAFIFNLGIVLPNHSR